MGALSTNAFTLLDWAKILDPEGKVAIIAELLSQRNDMLDDIIWVQGNLEIGHRTTVRTGLPSVYWRLLNQAVQTSKSSTAQITETCGMMEAWAELDKEVAELGGNPDAVRYSEAQAFLEALNQEMASTLFYGNSSVSPEEFNGLSVRYADKSAANAQNIIDAGGESSDNSSIWLVVWDENGIFGTFPKGSTAGLDHENLGLQTVQGSTGVAGTRMRVYQEKWNWKAGVIVKDWRQAVRICNIDISNLVAESSAADITKNMIKAMHRIGSLNMGNAAFYMNRTMIQMLDIQRKDSVSAGGGLTYENVDGKVIFSFRGVPIRTCDSLVENESRVT